MSNIILFPGRTSKLGPVTVDGSTSRRLRALPESVRTKIAPREKRPHKAVFARLLTLIRLLTFLALAWVGGPLTFILRLFAGMALLALPVIALGLHSPHKTAFILATAGTGFLAFTVSAGYDRLLRWLE